VNTIMLGAYVAATGMVKLETVEGCLSAVMPAKIVDLNVKALRTGAEYALKQLAAAPAAKKAAAAKASLKGASKGEKSASKKPAAKKK